METKVGIEMMASESVIEIGVIVTPQEGKRRDRDSMFLPMSVRSPKILRVARLRIFSHLFVTRSNGMIKF